MDYAMVYCEWRFEVRDLGTVPDKVKHHSQNWTYRPVAAEVVFTRRPGGPIRLKHAKVYGRRVLKSGELRENMSENFALADSDWPTWLQQAVAELRERFLEH